MSSNIHGTIQQIQHFPQDNNFYIIYFGAEWCGPCKVLKPIFSQVQQSLVDSGFIFAQVDLGKRDGSDRPTIADECIVRSIPTIIICKGGKILQRHSGILSREDLTKMIGDAHSELT